MRLRNAHRVLCCKGNTWLVKRDLLWQQIDLCDVSYEFSWNKSSLFLISEWIPTQKHFTQGRETIYNQWCSLTPGWKKIEMPNRGILRRKLNGQTNWSTRRMVSHNDTENMLLSTKVCVKVTMKWANWRCLGEAQIVINHTADLVSVGYERESIAVITPYKAQVELLSRMLLEKDFGDVQVGTVDQFQGQQFKAVIFSMVRYNPARKWITTFYELFLLTSRSSRLLRWSSSSQRCDNQGKIALLLCWKHFYVKP